MATRRRTCVSAYLLRIISNQFACRVSRVWLFWHLLFKEQVALLKMPMCAVSYILHECHLPLSHPHVIEITCSNTSVLGCASTRWKRSMFCIKIIPRLRVWSIPNTIASYMHIRVHSCSVHVYTSLWWYYKMACFILNKFHTQHVRCWKTRQHETLYMISGRCMQKESRVGRKIMRKGDQCDTPLKARRDAFNVAQKHHTYTHSPHLFSRVVPVPYTFIPCSLVSDYSWFLLLVYVLKSWHR